MNNEEIKVACEIQYEAIKKAENRLTDLRSICPHEIVFEGNYSYRVGSIIPAIICASCGDFIRMVNDPNQHLKSHTK